MKDRTQPQEGATNPFFFFKPHFLCLLCNWLYLHLYGLYVLIRCKHQWLLLLFRLHDRLKGLQMKLLRKRQRFSQFFLIIVHSASLVWGFYAVICLQRSPLRTWKILQECFTCKVLRKMTEDKLSDIYILLPNVWDRNLTVQTRGSHDHFGESLMICRSMTRACTYLLSSNQCSCK